MPLRSLKGLGATYIVIQRLERYPISVAEADKSLTWDAARLKAKYPIAYADCFALVLTKLKKAFLVTGDPEFKKPERKQSLSGLEIMAELSQTFSSKRSPGNDKDTH